MVSFLKRMLLFQIRLKKRFKAKTGVFVVYEQSYLKNQVDSLSMGGLSFYYVDSGLKIDKGTYELSLITNARISLGHIGFKTVSDTVTGEVLFQNKKIKRQSVQFENLSIAQKSQLKQIIRDHTIRV
ncbi:MAG: hypothetical protein HKM93_14765 [Desulfobacteraceae bacterium]|nr:hypothetical protein [Desulfobacteraceae bacterium]